jgi:hypothetical protein
MLNHNYRVDMEKRYQVFISSTYDDLKVERKEVMQVLLEADAIPAGMELFPATDDDQWTLIKRVIDASDYYIVIVGGRYGSIGPDGISYTEMEFRYAKETGKPILGFVHEELGKIPADFSEKTEEGRAKLEKFRALVKDKHCRFYGTPEKLGSLVSRGLAAQIKSTPGIGWVRGDQVSDEGAAKEILSLRHLVDKQQKELESVRVTAPDTAQGLASGDDEVELNYVFTASGTRFLQDGLEYDASKVFTWNEIFATVAPIMIDEASEAAFASALITAIKVTEEMDIFENDAALKGMNLGDFRIKEQDFHTVKIQLKALGLITKSTRNRSVKDLGTYWTLTPYGDTIMTQLRAIRKPAAAPLED